MSEGPFPKDQLSEFEARLKRLKEKVDPERAATPKHDTASGYGMAFRIASELVGGLIGGVLAGWLIDRWLNSAPAGLLIGFLLGAVGGLWNVYRVARGYDASLGYRSRPARQPGADGEERKPSAGARPGGERKD